MNPFGMRPIHSLDHLIKPIKDGSALQFIDQPDREIKCYTAAQAALGKGVPLYENGSVYHVKKKDLAEALGLNASTVTDDELNTEFIWHLIQIASTSYSMDSAALNGTKEILIGDYYRSIGEFEEGRRWTEIGLAKRFKPPDLTEDDLKKHTRLSLLGSPRSAQTLFDYYQKEMEINPFDESIKIKRRQALINAAQLELPDALLTLYYDAFDANSASYDKDFFQILVDIAIKKAETTDPEAKNQPGFDIYAIGMLFADRPFTEDIASHCFKVAIEKKFYSGYLGLAKIFNNPEDKVRHICLATQHGVTDGLSDLNKIAQDGKMKFILKIFLALLSSSGSLSPLAISWLHTNASNNPELFFGTSATLDMIAQKDKNIGSALLKELIKDPKMFSELLIVPLQSIISAEDFEAGCNISLMKSSDADEADRIITIFRNRSRDFYPDRNQRLLAQIPIDISAAIKFDRFIPNVLNHASNGNPKAIEVIKELATVNRPAALLALPKIELIETLSKVDLATFRTDAVDHVRKIV